MNQINIIQKFVEGAKYYMVVYKNEPTDTLGKILNNQELKKIDLSQNEIYRSVEYRNDDILFVLNLKPVDEQRTGNPL